MILLADVCLVLTNLMAFLYFMAFSAECLIVFVEYDWLLLFIELWNFWFGLRTISSNTVSLILWSWLPEVCLFLTDLMAFSLYLALSAEFLIAFCLSVISYHPTFVEQRRFLFCLSAPFILYAVSLTQWSWLAAVSLSFYGWLVSFFHVFIMIRLQCWVPDCHYIARWADLCCLLTLLVVPTSPLRWVLLNWCFDPWFLMLVCLAAVATPYPVCCLLSHFTELFM